MSDIVAGFVAGSAWNLASFWCLRRLLMAWLGPQPSRRRTIGWLLVKFPLLYAGAVLLLQSPWCSLVGFALGFSVVLIGALAQFIIQSQRMAAVRSYGR